MKVLISGHNGFIGKHLRRQIACSKNEILVDYLSKSDFKSSELLENKISPNDLIFHFAGVNRDTSEDKVFKKNIQINQTLHSALEKIDFKGKLVFASSIQEKHNTLYGKSKKDSRLRFQKQSELLGYEFIGLILPNVFGPFCKPNYNSFIATFSSMIIDGKKPKIIDDKIIELLYVNDLTNELSKIITSSKKLNIENYVRKIKVSKTLDKLVYFHNEYFDNGHIPVFNSDFDVSLFNTYRSYINVKEFFPKPYKLSSDDRGDFTETLRSGSKGQASYSTTKPTKIRGGHFHTRKIERFSIISGKAKIILREILSNEKIEFILDGKIPSYVDMPIWFTHNIQNIGNNELVTIFWVNEHYDQNDSDTFMEKV